MSRRTLRFTRLRVDRMPGIAPGCGFTVDDLASDVTLVVGPNGEGKTLSGRALMELLWPGAKKGLERATISGAWTLDGQRWTVDVDAGCPTWRREGVLSDRPDLPPAETRPHHWIGLRELLVDGGGDDDAPEAFAERIGREMLGGFDVPAAASALGFTASPRRPSKDARAVDAALETLQAAEAAARRQHDEAAALGELRRRREQAADADRRMRRLEQAIALRAAGDRLAALDAALAEDDARLDRLQGNEGERVEDARRRRDAATRAAADAADCLATATDAAEATRLPAGGVPDDVAGDLAAAADGLADAERRRREEETHRAGAEEERATRRAAIGPDIDDAVLRRLGPVPTPDLERLAREQSACRAVAARVEEEGRRLAEIRDRLDRDAETALRQAGLDEEPPLDDLRDGRTALVRWLVAPSQGAPSAAGGGWRADTGRGRRWSVAWLIAASLFAVIGVVLAVVVHVIALVALAAAAALAVVAWAGGTAAAAPPDAGDAGDRATREADYGRLGLPAPADWSSPSVERTVDALVEMMATWSALAEARRRLAMREEAHRAATASLDADARRLAATRAELESSLGIPLDGSSDDWLHALGGALAGWRDADARVARHEGQWRAIMQEAEQAAARFAERAAPYVDTLAARDGEAGAAPAHIPGAAPGAEAGAGAAGRSGIAIDADAARRICDDLQRRTAARRAADDSADRARGDAERAAAAVQDAEEDLERLFAAAGVDRDDEPTLRRLLEALPAHRERVQQRRDAAGRRDELERELGDEHPAPEADLAGLESLRDEARDLAAQRSEIDLRIGGIEQAIRAAGEGHDVEMAMQSLEEARGTMREHLEAAELAVAGSALAEWLREEDEERTRPRVLRRAAGFLTRFTHGRYELRMAILDGCPSFEAFDTRDGVAKRLKELSAGERIQLLLAVRLAFLEQEEHGVRLPIVLDEVLGTTDDARAGAIIDAVIEICRSGRQVLYLTAQPDEVGKWRSRLAAHAELGVRVVDLADVRGHAARDARPLEIHRPELPTVPPPDGMDHAAYGERIGVPGLQPSAGPGAVHAWHVVDDPAVLHRLLEASVSTLGPLLALHRVGAAGPLGGFTPAALAALPVRARAIDAAFDAWSIGRGRPVDRSVLLASGAVSDLFIDAVSRLAGECDGDAESILRGLEEGRVSRFKNAKIDELRTHFQEHGHLVDESPRDRDAITARVLAALAEDLEAGLVDVGWITTMVARLPDVSGPAATAAAVTTATATTAAVED